MSDTSYVVTGDGLPLQRSLAAVLRDSFSSEDDGTRLVLGTTVAGFSGVGYILVSIAGGPTLKVPHIDSVKIKDGSENTIGGYLTYLLATRTQLLAIGITDQP